jgi:hypothetical protein
MALKKADLSSKLSPKDILLDMSKVYLVELDDCNLISEIPKKLEKLDGKLGLNLFPKQRS